MRAVLYCRVSTVEQVANLSLPTQEKACREYAAREGYEVAEVFVDRGESAKTTDRPEFQRLITFCRQHTGKVQAVIVYGLSRFSRNTADHHAIAALLRGKGIALRSVTEPIDDSPTGRLMEGILASFSQFDNDVRAARTRAGLKAAAERGRWIWPAPLGYRTGSRPAGEPSLVPIAEMAPLIREAFETFGGSNRPLADIWRAARAAGLRTRTGLLLPMASLHNMFRSPVYCGVLRCDSLGVDRSGDWAAIVSPETWRAVQGRLGTDGRAGPKRAAHPDFALRGFVRCGACGRMMTAGWSRGKMGVRYAYYRCLTNCRGIAAPREQVEAAFLALLDEIRPSAEWLQSMHETILGKWRVVLETAQAHRNQLQGELGRIEAQLRRLDGLFIYEQAIDQESYAARRDELRERKQLTQIELNAAVIDAIDLDGELAAADHAIVSGARLWASCTSAERRGRLQRALLPHGVRWDGSKCLNSGNTLACYQIGEAHGVGKEVGGPSAHLFELVTAWSRAWRDVAAA